MNVCAITLSELSMEKPASLDERNVRAAAAQAKAAQAYARLLALTEIGDDGQSRRAALFLASTYSGEAFLFDVFELRAVDVATSDDMLACLDALRWGKAELYQLVPDGERRLRWVIDRWGPPKDAPWARP
jgi:hypothetical protein